MEHTREEFFQEARQLGLTPEMAVNVLRRNNIKGNYTPEKHDEYVRLLKGYVKAFERLMETVNKIESKYHPIEKCPVCGFPAERDSKRDGSLGEQHAWKCTNPDQGLVSHFISHRLEKIRPWMQRNQGMSDPEMSSEMLSIEFPSGVNQMEISS